MNKLFYSLTLAALVAPSVSARQLTPDEARMQALSYMSKDMKKAPALNAQGQLQLVQTMRSANGEPALYLFSGTGGQGLLVAPAESGCAPVLGYADSGVFDPASMPDNMKAWFENYAAEIQQLAEGRVARVPVRKAAEYASIEPMVQTRWNQGAPYNDLTPEINGQHTVTGCVATAMAQAMKVHAYPERGTGTVYATCDNNRLSLDLSQSTFNWTDMLNTYDNSATPAQREAVATLMRDCGYSVNMVYTSQVSGAVAAAIPNALVKNFNYDKAAHNLEREYFLLTDWEEIVYNELKAGRPVIYAGVSNSQGGHCFVCDGYSSDRYFHINWGWGGMSDGYFRLSALNPEMQGIGGSTSGFNTDQSIVVGMQRPKEGSDYYLTVVCAGNFSTQVDQYLNSQNIIFKSPNFINTSIVNLSGSFGVKLTDKDGNVQYARSDRNMVLRPQYAVADFYVNASALPQEGTYTVTPAFYQEGKDQWIDVMVPLNHTASLTLTCEDNLFTFTPNVVTTNLDVSDIVFKSAVYSNAKFQVTATVTNNGSEEYLGNLAGVLVDDAYNLVAQCTPANIDLEPGESMELDYISQFAKAPADGTYYFAFANGAGQLVGDPVEVEITTAPAGSVILSLDNLQITSGTGGSLPTVPFNNIVFEGTVVCNSGYFAGDITAYIFPATGGSSLSMVGSETFFLASGDAKDFKMKTTFGNGEIGARYMIAMFNGNQELRGVCRFILGDDGSGVDMVGASERLSARVDGDILTVTGCDGVCEVTVYTLDGSKVMSGDGVRMDVAGLAPGYYIAVVGTAEGNCIVKFAK